MSELDLARAYYAEELRAVANLQSEAVVKAFAKVPREHFLGPGPWLVPSASSENYWTTKDANPRHLYHNILVAIDESRRLSGCGTGYYTAILAEVVGREGHVLAV